MAGVAPFRPPPPIGRDPKQNIDELITQMKHFRHMKRELDIQDPGILAYVWNDRTPDQDGPYIEPLLKYDSNAAKSTLPVKREGYPGTLATVKTKFTNDGANAGNHSVKLEPAIGCPMEVLYAAVINGDTSARTTNIKVSSGGGTVLITLATASTGAGSTMPWPDLTDMGAARLAIVPTDLEFQTDCLAVAVSQDSTHVIVFRYYGGTAPTQTNSYPTGCTVAGVA